MYNKITGHIEDHREELETIWKEKLMNDADGRIIDVMPQHIFESTSTEFFDIILLNLKDKEREYKEKLNHFSDKVVRLGWPVALVVKGLREFVHTVQENLVQYGSIDKEREGDYLELLDKWMTPISNEIIQTYAETWEKTVSLQKMALQELSAPLIPVVDQISVMPLVGTIDTERARLVMENLLEGVVSHRSEVVLIDITGVPVVDTMVAHHIIQAAEAVHLVGAKCMLVGIRPEIAQTIVNLGIDLDRFITTSTMKKGVELALEMTGRKIVELEG
ncbi:STAS domain-containing protein [Jeotgalibacillus haloalkalitolerans]|uniref:STAS domain-containing protein n=1 Tax=Jeotgalibacillus haloalkalitolerans TaxID=3104292 RepID=A0ABU5KPH2_9BACL|nr:STAS domain-containing protein [Jeotgalibacillus sp. HH7-29]MDZ5713150.1 STAS domain-containing protein [Jeotgalibacillus sp. HH7-29]